jgi:hypothetical protein
MSRRGLWVQPAIDALLVPVAYATVMPDGSVTAARSSGLTSANVDLESTSAFCFYDLDFEFTVVQTSPLYLSDHPDTSIEIGYPDTPGDYAAVDCEGRPNAELEIATTVDSEWTPHGFTIVFFS